MPELKGISCTIHSEGGKFEEYEDDELYQEDRSTTSRYINIDGSEGKAFWIQLTCLDKTFVLDRSFDSIRATISVDGTELRTGSAWRSPYLPRVLNRNSYNTPSGTVEQTLLFCKLSLSEEASDSKNVSARNIKSLGEIVIQLRRAKSTHGQNRIIHSTEAKNDTKFHEKNLKGRDISHGVQFGESTTATNIAWVHLKPIDKDPFVQFRFLYRSRKALESLLILKPLDVPGSIKVQQSTNNPNQANKSPAEIEKEIKRLQALLDQANVGEVKQERKWVVKKEPGGRGQPKEIEVLDLTED
ncbi:hypothetical protein DFH27DRAFT_535690 [Peziza echinospora]|nr:hypothetical protein DFH27DRAFT_535690 [Peziza echinospora]